MITGLGDVKQSELSHSKMTVNNMNSCKAGMISGKGGVSNSSISFSTLTLKNSDHSHAGLAVGDGNAEHLNVSHSTVDASATGLIIGASTGLGNTHDSTITNITLNIPDSENSFIGLVSGKGNIDSSRVIQSRLTANGNGLRAAAGTACGNATNSIVNDTQLVFTKSDKSTLGIMTGTGDINNSHVSHSTLTASGAQLKVAAGTGHGKSQGSLIENSKVVLTDSTGSHAGIITGEGNIVNSSASQSSLTVSGNQLKAAVGTGQGNTTDTSVTYSSLTVTNTANSVLGGVTGQGSIENGLVDHFELTCSGAPVHAAAGSGIGSASNTSISNSKLLYQNNEWFNAALHAAQNSPPRGNIGLLVAKGDIKNSSVISSSITANGHRVNIAAGTSEGNADNCIVADTHLSLEGSYRTYAGILTGKGNASNSEISRSSIKVGAQAPIVGAGAGYGYVDGLSMHHVKVLSNGQYSTVGIGVGVGSANKINVTHSQVNVDGQDVEGAIGAANGIATNIYTDSCQVSSSQAYSKNIYLGIGVGVGSAENITSFNDKIRSTVNNAKQGIGVGYGNAIHISSEHSSVIANGDHSYSAIGAGLGNATAITSNHSKVQVVGKYPSAGIGVGKGNATTVSDAHSTIIAKGNYAQAGVGSGTGRSINIKSEQSSVSVSDKQGLFGNPKLMYGEVSEPFAGIGVGKGDASDVYASGSTVSASGDKSSTGIGAGSGNAVRVTSIHTRVSASGFKAAAGIGAGKGRSEHIVDTSSHVSASGQESSAGIGVGSGDAKHISSTQSKVSGRGDLFSASGIGAGRGTSNNVHTNNTTVTHSGKYCFAAVGTGKGSSTNITDISSQLKTTNKFCGVAIGSGSGNANKINANFSTIITDTASSASIGTGDGYAYSVKACKCNINGIETNINCQTSTPLSTSDTSTSAPLVLTENTTLPSMTVPDEVTVDVGPNPLVLGIGGTAAFIIGVPLGFCLISYAIAGLRDKKRGMELIRSPLTDAEKVWRFCRGGQSAVATEEFEMHQPTRAQPEAVL